LYTISQFESIKQTSDTRQIFDKNMLAGREKQGKGGKILNNTYHKSAHY